MCQWLFLVPLTGGIGGIVNPPIGRKNTTYIPLIVLAKPGGWLYATSHLLGEPETTIDCVCVCWKTQLRHVDQPFSLHPKRLWLANGSIIDLRRGERSEFFGGGKNWDLGGLLFFFGNSGGGWFGIQKEYPIQTGWVFDINEWWVYRLLNVDPLFELQDLVERIGNWRIWSYMYESPGLMKVVEW